MTEEPTPGQIEAAARAFYEHATELTNWGRLVSADITLAEAYRAGMRAALVAAAGAAPKEWGAIWPGSCTGEPSRWGNKEGPIRSHIESNPGMRLVRRRAAGPWEPVGGESA